MREREDPLKKFGSPLLNRLSRATQAADRKRYENMGKTFFPRKKDDENRNQKSVEFERKWNPR